MSNVAAVRRLREKLAKDKLKLLEVRKGDMVINSYGEPLMIVGTTTKSETLKETVVYVNQRRPDLGKSTITYDKLRKMHSQGKCIIHRGPAWSDDDTVDPV